MLICAVCEQPFNKYMANIQKNKGTKHFCSLDCWYTFNQGERHYLWTGGQHERMNPRATAWRDAVLERDKYFCRICRSQRRLEAHHILPFGKRPEVRWDVSNGLTLCHDCHVKFRNRETEHAEILQFIASVPVEVWRVDDDEGPDTSPSS